MYTVESRLNYVTLSEETFETLYEAVHKHSNVLQSIKENAERAGIPITYFVERNFFEVYEFVQVSTIGMLNDRYDVLLTVDSREEHVECIDEKGLCT